MRSLFTLLLGTAVTCSMALAQGSVSEHSPTGGVQSSPNSVSSVPNSNGTLPSSSQGRASNTPSTPNQSLPGNSNPANASAEGRPNGKAVAPQGSESGPGGTAAGNTPSTDGNANRPRNTGTTDDIAKPSLSVTMPWLWAGMGVIGALILIGILMRRDRSRGAAPRRDHRVVIIDNQDGARRDDDIRRVG
jgi:hypothetical protein